MCKVSSNDNCPQPPIQSQPTGALPAHVREQAIRFAHLTDRIMGRLNRIGSRLCRRCLHELEQNPEHYDQISSYHVDLLARAIRREVDALYHSLRVDTLDVIERSYQNRIRRSKKRKQ